MPVATLARAVNLAPSTLYDLMRSDSMSSTKLHLIAKALGLNVDWLETGRGPRLAGEPGPSGVQEPTTPYQPPLTPQEIQIARDWGHLQEPQRSVVAAQIRLLLRDQVREDSKQKGRRTNPDPRRLE